MLWVSFAYPLQAFKNGLWIVELKGHPYPPLSYSNTQPNKNAIHNVLLSEAAKDYRSNKKSWSDWSGHTLYSCQISYSCINLRTTIHSVLSTKKNLFSFFIWFTSLPAGPFISWFSGMSKQDTFLVIFLSSVASYIFLKKNKANNSRVQEYHGLSRMRPKYF